MPMDPLIEVSTGQGENMRETCARVLAAALMTGAIAAVVAMSARRLLLTAVTAAARGCFLGFFHRRGAERDAACRRAAPGWAARRAGHLPGRARGCRQRRSEPRSQPAVSAGPDSA